MAGLAPAPIELGAPAPAVDEIVVVVTLNDVALGRRGHPMACPVWHAAVRAIGYGQLVHVGRGQIWVYPGLTMQGLPVRYFNKEASQWVRDYDKKLPVAPERFVFRRVAD